MCSRFTRNSEAEAFKFLENIPYDNRSRFKSTLYCIVCRKCLAETFLKSKSRNSRFVGNLLIVMSDVLTSSQ